MSEPEPRKPVRWWVWLIAGLILALLVAALIRWWQPLYDLMSELLPSQEQVAAWVESLGIWGPVAIILLEMIQALLAPIPGQAIEAVSGYLYGPWLGTLFPMIGMAIGSFIIFSLSRRFGRPLVVKLIGQKSMAQLYDLVRRGGAPFFFLIWLLPGAPDDLACVAAGLTPMPTRQFMVLMLVGRLPGVFMSVLFGTHVNDIPRELWIALFAAIAIVALVVWRWGDAIQETIVSLIERLSLRMKK
jgi:uncharacterized membrane protein YdjX (TVP38/TMEM64 family)